MDVEFKSNIMDLRKAKGLTRPQLADLVGLSWETIKAYEVKGALPSLKVFYLLADALECQIDELYDVNIIHEKIEI